VLRELVERMNQRYQQTLQQHNSKQAQAAAELMAAPAQQQLLQQQLHALHHQNQHLEQQLVEAVAVVGHQQHDMSKVLHLLVQQKEQLDIAVQKVVVAGRINMQERQHLTQQQQHNSQLQQLCDQQQAAAQQQAQQLQHLQQQHQAMRHELQQQLLHKDVLLAQQQCELDQLRQWVGGLQHHHQWGFYPTEMMGGFRSVYSWQPTSQQPPVAYQGRQEVQQQQWQQQSRSSSGR